METLLLTPQETARLLGYSLNGLAKMRMAGRGPAFVKAYGPKGRIRYTRAAIEEWIASRTRRSTSEQHLEQRGKGRKGAA